MAGYVRGAECVGKEKAAGLREMPFGAQILPDSQGTLFRLWAPTAQNIELVIEGGPTLPMPDTGGGWRSALVPEIGHGALYRYRIDGNLQVPDPASRWQPQDVHDASMVIDPTHFEWQDAGWRGRPWHETVLYELHVGTFSPEGTFAGVKNRLDYLVDLGVTAIELMPVADFPGARNWGYDGTLLFAPDSTYGTPDDLKDLVQTAHQKGLMVFLDVVYNHFGPEGNYLHCYAKHFFTEHHHTPWGAAINFEGSGVDGEARRTIRDFFIQNALYWLKEYHFDGLRFDAVHAILDDSDPQFLNELVETVRANVDPARHVHLVLENDDNSARYLTGAPEKTYSAQWNDDFHHAGHVLLTGDTGGYYCDYAKAGSGKPAIAHLARCLTEGFAYQGDASAYRDGERRGESSAHLPPLSFVNFLQNHDQIGNRAFGERLSQLASPEALRAGLAVLLLSPGIPLLFMGEEWQTERPFLFFCDFGADLAPLVTEGRRKEFAKFPEFSDPAVRARIPDPVVPATFEASRLDWDELQQPAHAAWLALCKKLLAIRSAEIMPMLPLMAGRERPRKNEGVGECSPLGNTAIAIQYPISDGRSLCLAANLGDEPLTFSPVDHHNLKLRHWTPLYQSGENTLEALQSGKLAAWTVVWAIQQEGNPTL